MSQDEALPQSVLLAGGGTAGHVSPMLAVADALAGRDPQMAIRCLGTQEGLESTLVPARGYSLSVVSKVPLPRRPSVDVIRVPRRLTAAVGQAADAIADSGAEVVVGFGGYVATPAYLAARRRGIPIVVHEQNARPGLANRLGARLTPWVATTFPDTQLAHARVVGMPLRREVTELDRASQRVAARRFFGLPEDGVTLLVFGGSLGAQRLNESFELAIPQLRDASVNVLHITGRGKSIAVPEQANYVAIEYCDRMELAYAAADLCVSRAGASTVCELTAVGLPAIYVPLPIGNGEQRFNVEAVVAAGGGEVVDNNDVTPQWIADTVIPLASDTERLDAMSVAAASVGVRDADEVMVDLIARAATRSVESAS